jgi:hypothetical protein
MPTATFTGRELNQGQALNQIVANTGALVSGGISPAEPTGAAHLATGQVASSTTAGTLVIARSTRTSVLFRNLDATISVYIGPATVTSGNGMLLKAGESVSFTDVGLIQVIAASGTPTIAFADEYN